MRGCYLVVMIDEDNQVSLEAKATGEEAEQCAIDWLLNLYPRAKIKNIDDVREFEERHSVLVDFYWLQFNPLCVEAA